jgi:hypothetical protein
MEKEFTGREAERQDCVDNAIYNLLLELGLTNEDSLEWDIEEIGEVRDAIQDILVGKHKIMSEQQFYPYRELEGYDEKGRPISTFNRIVVPLDDLDSTIKDQIDQWDFEELASIASDWFGGKCYWAGTFDGEDLFFFEPDEEAYQGAFDYLVDRP